MDVCDKIRVARTVKGYSQEYMASKFGITQKTSSVIENNPDKLNVQKLNEIADILEMDLGKLLSLNEDNIFPNSDSIPSKNNKNLLHNQFLENERESYKNQLEILEKQLRIMRSERNSLILFFIIALSVIALSLSFYIFS